MESHGVMFSAPLRSVEKKQVADSSPLQELCKRCPRSTCAFDRHLTDLECLGPLLFSKLGSFIVCLAEVANC